MPEGSFDNCSVFVELVDVVAVVGLSLVLTCELAELFLQQQLRTRRRPRDSLLILKSDLP